MNNQTLWYYQPLDRQVLIQNFSDVVLTDLPVAFLLGIGDLRKDFKLEKACSNENGVVLDLSPVENDLKKQELDGFRLLINQELKFPSGAEIIHLGGNKTSIILDNLKLQEKIDDSVYEASFPKGVDVNDMRK